MQPGRLFAAALCAVLLLSIPALGEQAATAPYGAIASEKRSDKTVGDAVDYASKAEAVNAAISECNERAGGKHVCVLRVWFHNQHCAAYLADSKETAHYYGDTREDAIQKGLDDFPEAHVVDAACN